MREEIETAARLFERAMTVRHHLRQRLAPAGACVLRGAPPRALPREANAREPLESRLLLNTLNWTGLGDEVVINLTGGATRRRRYPCATGGLSTRGAMRGNAARKAASCEF